MTLSRFALVWIVSGALVMPGAGAAPGQGFPNKPIRIVTGGVGGSSDFVARVIAQGISGGLGQPVIVDNRSGAIPGEIVSKTPPDGYNLLVTGGGHWIEPLMQITPSDPLKDFSSITLAVSAPNILVVHPSVPVRSVKELIALARARPGELNYASGNTGSTPHLAAELFKAMAGVNIVRIPYKGSGPALNDLVGGQVQLTFGAAGALAPHTKSGRLRALAVSSAQPSLLAPGLPTVAASGLPGYEAGTITGIFASAGTPAAIITRLNREIVRFLRTAEAKEKFLNSGVEAIGSSPEEFTAAIKLDMAKWGKLIKDAGIRVD